MKGVGKIEGWKISRRGKKDIVWKNKKGKKIAISKAYNGRQAIWEVFPNFPHGQVKTFRKKERALIYVKGWMKKHK